MRPGRFFPLGSWRERAASLAALPRRRRGEPLTLGGRVGSGRQVVRPVVAAHVRSLQLGAAVCCCPRPHTFWQVYKCCNHAGCFSVFPVPCFRLAEAPKQGFLGTVWERDAFVWSGTQPWSLEGTVECAGHGMAGCFCMSFAAWSLLRVVLRWLSSPAMPVGIGSSGAAEMTATRQRARPDTCTRALLAGTLRTHARTLGELLRPHFEVLPAFDRPRIHVCGPAPVVDEAQYYEYIPHMSHAGTALPY